MQASTKCSFTFSWLMLLAFICANGSKPKETSYLKFCRFIDRVQIEQLPDAQRPATLRDIIQFDTKLGKGGFGEVYPAVWNGKPVAIKVSRATASNLSEINFLLELQDVPNVPRIYDCERDSFNVYLVQSLLYSDLADDRIINTIQSWPLGERAHFLQSIAKTLQKIHNKGVIHNDIKLINLMINRDRIDRVYFIDFGIARRKGSNQRSGTLIFESPEKLIAKDYAIDEKEDVWALGLTFSDIEVGMQSKHLSLSHEICLENAIKPNGIFSARFAVGQCMQKMVASISDAFVNEKSRINYGCNDAAFDKYKTVILQSIQVNKNNRSTLPELIDGLEEVLKECEYEHTDLDDEEESESTSLEVRSFAKKQSIDSPNFGAYIPKALPNGQPHQMAQVDYISNILSDIKGGVVNWFDNVFRYFAAQDNRNSPQGVVDLAEYLKDDNAEELEDEIEEEIPLSSRIVVETAKPHFKKILV